MKFTEIIKKSTGDSRIMDGYLFIGRAYYTGDLHDNDVDSFYDGWNGNIELGEDGKLYLVERINYRAAWEQAPVIWCQVEQCVERYPEIAEIAARIRSSDTWSPEDCKALCEAADMADAWECSDGESFERVVFDAAKRLGVEIV